MSQRRNAITNFKRKNRDKNIKILYANEVIMTICTINENFYVKVFALTQNYNVIEIYKKNVQSEAQANDLLTELTESKNLYEKKIICPYCKNIATLINGEKVYPENKNQHKNFFYECEPCEAFVGCHPNSTISLGTPAKIDLRQQRKLAHIYLDKVWESKIMTRSETYLALANYLGVEEAHIGEMNLETCSKTIKFASEQIEKEQKNNDKNENVICPYCNKIAELIKGKEIYPNTETLHNKLFYICKPCDAITQCDEDGITPTGTLANQELRQLRKIVFNNITNISKKQNISYNEFYKSLKKQLNFKVTKLAKMDLETCKKIIDYIKNNY